MQRTVIASYVDVNLRQLLMEIAEEQNTTVSKVVEAILQKHTTVSEVAEDVLRKTNGTHNGNVK